MTDAMEAARQDVKQEAADELVGGERLEMAGELQRQRRVVPRDEA